MGIVSVYHPPGPIYLYTIHMPTSLVRLARLTLCGAVFCAQAFAYYFYRPYYSQGRMSFPTGYESPSPPPGQVVLGRDPLGSGYRFIIVDNTGQNRVITLGTRLNGSWFGWDPNRVYEMTPNQPYWREVPGAQEEVIAYRGYRNRVMRPRSPTGAWGRWAQLPSGAGPQTVNPPNSSAQRAPASTRTTTARPPEAPINLQSYVQKCAKEGVSFPSRMNCSEGIEIPIYKTFCDARGNETKVRITPENFSQYAPDGKMTCDNPAHVMSSPGHSCMPGSRVQRIAVGGSQCAVMCRKYYQRTAPGNYDDINVICHNPTTGGTCFANSITSDARQGNAERTANISVNGENLPAPGSPGEWRWDTPQHLAETACVRCHDKEPFLNTPYVSELGIVPINRGTASVRSNPRGRYYTVGAGTPPFDKAPWSKRKHLVSPQAQLCTNCHRIGDGASCGWMGDLLTDPKGGPAQSQNCPSKNQAAMPPKDHGSAAETKETMAFIKKCCDLEAAGQSDGECQWKEIPGRLAEGESDTWDAGSTTH